MAPTVYMENCPSYARGEVAAALERLFRRSGFAVKSGSRVLVKPNIMAQNRPGQHSVTGPALIDAVCGFLSDSGCRITIGESIAFYENGLTRKAFRVSGAEDVARRHGAELCAFDEERLVRVSEGSTALPELFIPERVFESDAIIGLPKLKTHMALRFSGAVKNIFGVLPGGYKQKVHMMTDGDLSLSDVFIDLWNILKPVMSVMDAVVGLDGGPSAIGRPVPVGFLLSSDNPAALDCVACRMIGYAPEQIPALVRARDRGMIPSFDGIGAVLDGADIPPGKIPRFEGFRNLVTGPFEPKVKDSIFITGSFAVLYIREYRCTKCGDCAAFCAPGAITARADDFPTIDPGKCLSCYGCAAFCPEKAIGLRTGAVNKAMRFLRMILRI
ncbi:MAG: DUF362 domain-containing protein [Spirochaetes bacterium]|nr:DUF362 domain-containing protein [Spirochaetota bacterium]